MGNAPMGHFEPETKHTGSSTKHTGSSTKHTGSSTKRFAEEMPDTYADFGAYGDYVVTTHDGTELPIFNAITIRVLERGELNLVTDSGRWFLFAPSEWKRVYPAQPQPGQVSVT
jgi:hypothetical protein